jgi:hypothetical protein
MGGAAVSSLLATPTPTSRPRPVSTTTAPFSVNLSTAAARAPRLLLLSRRPRPRPAAAVLGVSDDTGVKMAGSDIVGKNDLLIVGPGVLGRLVAEKWQEVLLSDCPIVILYLSYLPCVSYWFKLRKPYSSFIVWSIIFFLVQNGVSTFVASVILGFLIFNLLINIKK